MTAKQWGVWCVCRGMMAGLAREAWLKVDGSVWRGTEAEARAKATEATDKLGGGISRLNISYQAI